MTTPEGISEQELRSESVDNIANRKFGMILRSYRQRTNLSLRAAGRMLGIAHSTLIQIEFGKRKPPHTKRGEQFLSKLRELPGITEEELTELLSSREVPNWLSKCPNPTELRPARNFLAASVPGIRVTMYFDIESSTVPLEDQTDLTEIVRHGVQLNLRGYLRQKEELAKLGQNETLPRLTDTDSQT